MSDMSNGMPLRVIQRKEKTVWCITETRFSEDMNKRKRVKDEARSRQVGSIYLHIHMNEQMLKYKYNENIIL